MFSKVVLCSRSHEYCLRDPVEPHPQEHLGMIAINFSLCNGCVWYFTVVLTCISLPISDFDLFIFSWSAICLLYIMSIQNFSPHEKLDRLSYGILNTDSLSDICLTTIFSQLQLLFCFSFEEEEFHFDEFQYIHNLHSEFIFPVSYLTNLCLTQCH